jgi:hypothetical protein
MHCPVRSDYAIAGRHRTRRHVGRPDPGGTQAQAQPKVACGFELASRCVDPGADLSLRSVAESPANGENPISRDITIVEAMVCESWRRWDLNPRTS